MPTRTGRRRVYICGPISARIGISHERKLLRFHKAESWLKFVGYIDNQKISCVVNPLKVEPACDLPPRICAANSTRLSQSGQDGEESHAWECYMKADIAALMRCDDIALLPGWDKSPGAIEEHTLAGKVGITSYEFKFDEEADLVLGLERLFG